jgi:protein-S-isoprenylcysteine O-methyltransferase Ste14
VARSAFCWLVVLAGVVAMAVETVQPAPNLAVFWGCFLLVAGALLVVWDARRA